MVISTGGAFNPSEGDLLQETNFFIDNLLVRIHLIVVMISWTGLAPWAFEFPFPGSLATTFLYLLQHRRDERLFHMNAKARIWP